jgi:MATE family, multidrug efflux pump
MKDLTPGKTHSAGGVREMLAIAFPMVISQGCDTVMIFTDRLFLSRLGPEAMSASMGGGLTSFMMMAFFLGLTGYATALVAQYLGAGQRTKCALVVTQALLIIAVAYPLILSARPLGHLLFRLFKPSPGQLALQRIYFDIMLYASCVGLLRNSLSCFFSGIGRTRVVMIATFVSLVVNIGANYVLIFGKFGFPALGIRGAAYGTILGGVVGLAVLVSAYLTREIRREFGVMQSFHFAPILMKKLWRFGTPSGVEFLLNMLAFNALILTFHAVNATTSGAVTIVINWDMMAFIPLIGVNIGVTSLVGRYMGAGDPDSAHRATMSGLRLVSVYSFAALIAFAVFPDTLVRLFLPAAQMAEHPGIFPMATFMLRMVSLYVMADAVMLVYGGALRGAGDTFWVMCASVLVHWLGAGILMILLRGYKVSPESAWCVFVGILLSFTAVFFLRYRSGKWRALRVVGEADASECLE